MTGTVASARQLEREAEEQRRHLSSTLDHLADNLTPGRMLDEVISYSRGGGASFLKGLGNSASQNPLPTLLIGVGAAMYLSGKGRADSIPDGWSRLFSRGKGGASQAREQRFGTAGSAAPMHAGTDTESAVTTAARSTAAGAKHAAASVGSAISDASDQVVSAAETAATGVAHAARDLAGTAVDAASEQADHLAAQLRQKSDDLRTSAAKLAQEQPLIAAAAGVALGALIAALLPRTSFEDEVMGEESDAVKSAAGEFVAEQVDAAVAEAGAVAEEVKASIAAHTAAPEEAAGIAKEFGRRIETAVGGSSS